MIIHAAGCNMVKKFMSRLLMAISLLSAGAARPKPLYASARFLASKAPLFQVAASTSVGLSRPAATATAIAPVVPVVANVLAKPISEPAEIVRALVAQVTGTVRWRESVAVMAGAGVKTFYEVGAGKVLSGLIKRISEGASATAIGSPEDIAAYKAGRST